MSIKKEIDNQNVSFFIGKNFNENTNFVELLFYAKSKIPFDTRYNDLNWTSDQAMIYNKLGSIAMKKFGMVSATKKYHLFKNYACEMLRNTIQKELDRLKEWSIKEEVKKFTDAIKQTGFNL